MAGAQHCWLTSAGCLALDPGDFALLQHQGRRRDAKMKQKPGCALAASIWAATFGHAIESEQGYGNWLHGEAVAAGTVLAAQTALQLGLLKSGSGDAHS